MRQARDVDVVSIAGLCHLGHAILIGFEQAEVAYRRLVTDWKATGPAKAGAGATPGRASNRPSKGKAARQTTSP